MHALVPRRRFSGSLKVLAAAALGGAVGFSALAQESRRMVAVRDDSNGGRSVVNVSMPDLMELREPDFTRQDIHTLDSMVKLTDPQRTIIFALHDAYITAFGEAMKALGMPIEPQRLAEHRGEGAAPAPGEEPQAGQPLQFTFGGIDDDFVESLREAGVNGPVAVGITVDMQGPPGVSGNADDAGSEGEPAPDVAADEASGAGDEGSGAADAPDSPPDLVVIDQHIEAGGEGDAAGGLMTPKVAISLDAGDDVPDEIREQLEQIAQQISEQVAAQVEAQQGAWADENGNMLPMPMMPGDAASIEEMQQRMAELQEKADDFAREKKKLRDQFVSDVQAQLSFEQVSLWPAYERKLTRDKTLPKSRLDGESTDLLKLVDQLQLDDEARDELHDVSYAYEIALHEALVRRNDFLAENRRKIDQLLNEGEARRALGLVDRATELRVAVRTLNEQSLDAFAQKLPAESVEPFRQSAMRSFHPRVYRQTRAQRAFEKAATLEGISPDVAAAIDELHNAYEIELQGVNQSLRQTIREHQPGEARQSIAHLAQIMEGEDHGPPPMLSDDDPIHAAFDKRSELDERFMKQLYSMFTDEQVASLPRLPSQARSSTPIMFRAIRPD
jgi:hypothetical protein